MRTQDPSPNVSCHRKEQAALASPARPDPLRIGARPASGWLMAAAIGLMAASCQPDTAAQEAQLVEALVPLCQDLPRIMAQPQVLSAPQVETGKMLGAALESHRLRLLPLGDRYRALAPARQRAVQARVSVRCGDELTAFYQMLGRYTLRFAKAGERELFIQTLRQFVPTWQQSRTLWAFELFSTDAVNEIQELLENEDEHELATRSRKGG